MNVPLSSDGFVRQYQSRLAIVSHYICDTAFREISVRYRACMARFGAFFLMVNTKAK